MRQIGKAGKAFIIAAVVIAAVFATIFVCSVLPGTPELPFSNVKNARPEPEEPSAEMSEDELKSLADFEFLGEYTEKLREGTNRSHVEYYADRNTGVVYMKLRQGYGQERSEVMVAILNADGTPKVLDGYASE